MAEADKKLELKFRIFDGTDIGHGTYSRSITAATLKQRLLSQWPRDKSIVPKSVNDMKLIHAGKFLENGKTLAESRVAQVGDLSGGVITMHVVVQPPVAKRKIEKFTHCVRDVMQIKSRRRNRNKARVLARFSEPTRVDTS